MQVQNNEALLKVFCDELAENPRNWENVGTMVCWHRRYSLGDRHDYNSPNEFIGSEVAQNAFVLLPIFLYDHSVQKLSTQSFLGRAVHADFDSGQVGYIFIEQDKVQSLTGLEPTEHNKEAVQEILCAETELYSSYLEGDCYAYSIESFKGEILDSCGGFYGNDMSKILLQMKEQSPHYSSLFAKMQSHVQALYSVIT